MKSYFPKIRFRVGLGRWLIVFSLLITALTIGQILQSSALAMCDTCNKPPVANPDSATTPMNTPLDIKVLANDTDPNGDPLTVWVSDDHSAAGGTLQGTPYLLHYTPPANFAGTDTFSYIGYDGNLTSNKALVTVTVTNDVSPGPLEINLPPVAVDDSAAANVNATIKIDVKANDYDPNGDKLLIWGYDQQSALGGFVYDTGNGTIMYVAPNVAGTDTFNYELADGSLTSVGTVTVTVTDAVVVSDPNLQINLPPVAVDDSVSTPMNSSVDFKVVANDSDPNGDPLKLGTWDGTSAAGGFVLDANGTNIFYIPPKDFVGTDTITYTAYDGSLFSNKATLTVTVTPLRSSEK
jgi:large repetitive protein